MSLQAPKILLTKTKTLRKNLFILFLACLTLSFSSCISSRQSAYFKTIQQDATIKNLVTPDFDTKIVAGDHLSIEVSSLSPENDAFYNSAAGSLQGQGGKGYIVNKEGEIIFHHLGVLKVTGLTRSELSNQLKEQLTAYLKDAVINVNFINHKITILGGLGSSQVMPLPDEKLSIIEVMAMSGGVNPNSRLDKVVVIREEDSVKRFKFLNLEDHSIFNSPYYYVKNNDIIYVLPDTEKQIKEEKRREIQTTMALVASGLSFIFILFDRLLR